MRLLFLLLAFAPLVAAASGKDEQFAREMLICGYKYQAYSLAPGDATISDQAIGQVDLYLAAATKFTDAGFIERETAAMKEKGLNAALAEFSMIKGGNEELIAAWAAVKEGCDQKIAEHQHIADGL